MAKITLFAQVIQKLPNDLIKSITVRRTIIFPFYGCLVNLLEVPWEENPQPWKKVPTLWKKVSTAACFYGPPPRRK